MEDFADVGTMPLSIRTDGTSTVGGSLEEVRRAPGRPGAISAVTINGGDAVNDDEGDDFASTTQKTRDNPETKQ